MAADGLSIQVLQPEGFSALALHLINHSIKDAFA